jgi:3-deoxy-D-manno-octulosonic-acid transferase
LYILKKLNRKIIIINGRLTPKSLRHYLLWPDFWKALRPDKILAISAADVDRFAKLFDQNNVATMNNIKFDRLVTIAEKTNNPLASFLPESSRVLTLGSVRQEEEDQIINIITDIQKNLPETIIGLFPRHMHRIDFWKATLRRLNIKWQLRSEINNKPVQNGTIILWDMFGELNLAYALSDAVFVGGSLAPLGGQNFLEPLIHGISPVIGPFWDNFTWVGKDIFTQGLVIKTANWQSVAAELVKQMQHNNSDKIIQKKAIRYIKNRKGGTTQACNLIKNMLHA